MGCGVTLDEMSWFRGREGGRGCFGGRIVRLGTKGKGERADTGEDGVSKDLRVCVTKLSGRSKGMVCSRNDAHRRT